MSELSYKELQEQGVFDVPYKAFEFMQEQQAKIDELQARIDDVEKWIESNRKTIALEYSGYTTEEYVDADEMMNILKGNKDEKII